MSQNENNLYDIIVKFEELKIKIQDYENYKQEFEELKIKIQDYENYKQEFEELKIKIQDYENYKQEFEELKIKIDDLITYELPPINEHVRKWDSRDVYLFRTKVFFRKYIYTPIHIGVKTTFFIVGKIFLALIIGIISGILLNTVGLGTLFKNFINFLSHIFY